MVSIRLKSGWIEPLNIYSLTIAESGEKKSPVLREVVSPIIKYERGYNETHKEEIAQNRKELEMLHRELEDLTSRATKKNSKDPVPKEEVFQKQKEIENFKKEVRRLRLLADDVTPEAFTSLLARNDGLISIISSEGGLFDTLSGRFSDSPYIDPILKAYCGDPISVDRITRTEEDIPEPYATILLSVQPDVINGLIKNTIFRRRGLPARFLYSKPDTIRGSRRYITQEVPEELTRRYEELSYDLLNVKVSETPLLLKLSKDAEQLSEKFFYELEARFNKDLESIQDFAAKLHGNIARIAGILHVVDNYNFIFDTEMAVSGETFQNAINIGNYFLEHAIIVFGQAGADERLEDAKYLWKRIREYGKPEIT